MRSKRTLLPVHTLAPLLSSSEARANQKIGVGKVIQPVLNTLGWRPQHFLYCAKCLSFYSVFFFIFFALTFSCMFSSNLKSSLYATHQKKNQMYIWCASSSCQCREGFRSLTQSHDIKLYVGKRNKTFK